MPVGLGYYLLKMNLNSGVNQTELMQNLKSNGDDVIQTSNGLCLKSKMSMQELNDFLASMGASEVVIEEIDTNNKEKLSTDVASFVG